MTEVTPMSQEQWAAVVHVGADLDVALRLLNL